MLLVSACLAGLNVRYDASNKLDETVRRLVAEGRAIMVCPEMLGGLTTPREPAEIVGGHGQDVLDGTARVMTQSGIDVTAAFLEGAYRTLEKAQSLKATKVVLKEYSPSCGSSLIYDGRFDGKAVAGNGVTAALLQRHGIQVISERQLACHVP
ncbi:DUF523 domain-containing protein [Modicisalibacter luteus]|uniref:DUF523 domain-containing protein n=1 Tax=Modicisalibacter luteus TaxID=453962 RepID=A0ABV7LZ36_9GAMM|nr:DUF523 domain-containing protein [Halomonas lutea]GHA96144.1 hypothetical protein GCM10007159_17280 [Halomonas lutea]